MHLGLLFLVWMCTLVGLLLCLKDLAFMLRPHICLCSLHGCGRITNLQYTAQGMAYMCISCSGVHVELCTAGIVIALPHPSPLLLPLVCWL